MVVLHVEAAIGTLIEHHSQFFKPGDGQRRIVGQGRHQLGVIGEVAAAHGIQVMIEG